MQLLINGEAKNLNDGITVADLLAALEFKSQQVAVEVNRDLVPREEHADHKLSDGDHVEVVTLVGGG